MSYVIVESLLGLQADPDGNVILDPWLPARMTFVEIEELRVGDQKLHLIVRGQRDDVEIDLRSNSGNVGVRRAPSRSSA